MSRRAGKYGAEIAGVVLAAAVALDTALLRAEDAGVIGSRVDWPEFLKRHDLV